MKTKRQIIATACAASLLVAGVAGTSVASSHRTVMLNVDGVSFPVSAFANTVGDVLDHAEVQVSAHDVVAPAVDSSIKNGDTVLVRHANPYDVVIDGDKQTVWSTGTSIKDILSNQQQGVVMAADRSQSRPELSALEGAGTVTVKVDGTSKTVQGSQSDTVDSLLRKAGITVSPIDRVFFGVENGAVVVDVTRVTRGVVSEQEEVDFTTEQRDDDSLVKGQTSVIQEGQKGVKTTTFWVETVDGKTTVKTQTGESKTDPVTEIVAVGTKDPVTITTSGGSTSTAATAGTGTGSAPAGVWAALAQCESGGNPATNTGNGYYGLYQFSLSTWRSVGGSGLPSDASAAEQTARAQTLQARSGWGQWPACSSKLGLR